MCKHIVADHEQIDQGLFVCFPSTFVLLVVNRAYYVVLAQLIIPNIASRNIYFQISHGNVLNILYVCIWLKCDNPQRML